MKVTRQQFVDAMVGYVGAKFSDQGRSKENGFDCGGLFLTGARQYGLSELEFLGYARFPTDGEFERLLEEHTRPIGEHRFPFKFTGTEFQPADLLSFDYGNGEGTRHMAMIVNWDGRRYRILEAQPDFGVCVHALAHPFVNSKTVLKSWALPGLK